MDVQVVDWFGEGEPEASPLLKGCHSCLCKAKAGTGHPRLNPDAASTQPFIITSLLHCLQKWKRETEVLERDKKLSKKEDFYGKELNWPQAKLHNIFSISMYVLTSPHWMGGFICKESNSVLEGVRKEINAPKAKNASSSLNTFGIIYWENSAGN